jgi:hypothetical protein
VFNYRIIHIRWISSIPYPTLHPHIIGFGLSTSARIILKIRIRCRSEQRLSVPLSTLDKGEAEEEEKREVEERRKIGRRKEVDEPPMLYCVMLYK